VPEGSCSMCAIDRWKFGKNPLFRGFNEIKGPGAPSNPSVPLIRYLSDTPSSHRLLCCRETSARDNHCGSIFHLQWSKMGEGSRTNVDIEEFFEAGENRSQVGRAVTVADSAGNPIYPAPWLVMWFAKEPGETDHLVPSGPRSSGSATGLRSP
jgi:hypothetical protein